VFPAHKPVEDWPAGPFLFIDANKRPYVLTRLKDRSTGIWEYTRYRAEANSVISSDSEPMLSWVALPTEAEYQQPEDVLAEATAPTSPVPTIEPTESVQEPQEGVASEPVPLPTRRAVGTFGEAIEAIRSGDFDAAIPFLELLVQQRPNYHIGWLRLGYAQREQAARMPSDEQDEAMHQLKYAVESLTHALGHVDQEYRASAYYERSKAYYRKYVIGKDRMDAEAAVDDAKEAAILSSEYQFQTWLDYLHRLISQVVIVAR